MIDTNLTYPIKVDRTFSDWYRNYAIVGRANPHLPIGYDMHWSFRIRAGVGSCGINSVLVMELAIL